MAARAWFLRKADVDDYEDQDFMQIPVVEPMATMCRMKAEPASRVPSRIEDATPSRLGTSLRDEQPPADAPTARCASRAFSALQVWEMLQSAHVAGMTMEMKRSAVLLAIEANGGSVQEVVDDGIARLKLLDTGENRKLKQAQQFETHKQEARQRLRRELERLIYEHEQQIHALDQEIFSVRAERSSWELQRTREEQRLTTVISLLTTGVEQSF